MHQTDAVVVLCGPPVGVGAKPAGPEVPACGIIATRVYYSNLGSLLLFKVIILGVFLIYQLESWEMVLAFSLSHFHIEPTSLRHLYVFNH